MHYWRKKYGLAVILGATVVAVTLFGMEAIKAARTRRAIDAVRRLGGSAYRSNVCFDDGIPHGALKPMNPPGWPTRCAQALGVDWFFDVVHVDFRGNYKGNPVPDADLAILAEFPHLLDLDLCDTGIGDEGLKYVAKLTDLRRLDLRRTHVTDAGLARLAGLKGLEFLNLDGTSVKGWGVDRLRRTVPGVNAGPMFESGMAARRKLEEDVDELIKSRHSTDAVMKAAASPSSVGHDGQNKQQ